MFKILLFAFLFNLAALHTTGSSFTNPIQDTLVVDSSNYHLNKKQFLEAYGHHDKSRSFIKLFFHKRSIGLKMLVAGSITLVGCGILAAAFAASASGYGFLFAFVLLLGSIAGFVLAIIGLSILLSYNRKKLLKKLQHPELLPPAVEQPQPKPRPNPFKKKQKTAPTG
jgi:hypothetical protein